MSVESIFEIASNLDTPLALGGLFAAILFLILKKIIDSGVFGKVTRNSTSEILKLIINRLFLLALVSMFLGFGSYVLQIVMSANEISDIKEYDSDSEITTVKDNNEELFYKIWFQGSAFVVERSKVKGERDLTKENAIYWRIKSSSGVEISPITNHEHFILIGASRASKIMSPPYVVTLVKNSGKQYIPVSNEIEYSGSPDTPLEGEARLVFQEGVSDYGKDVKKKDNPYLFDYPRSQLWLQGWYQKLRIDAVAQATAVALNDSAEMAENPFSRATGGDIYNVDYLLSLVWNNTYQEFENLNYTIKELVSTNFFSAITASDIHDDEDIYNDRGELIEITNDGRCFQYPDNVKTGRVINLNPISSALAEEEYITITATRRDPSQRVFEKCPPQIHDFIVLVKQKASNH